MYMDNKQRYDLDIDLVAPSFTKWFTDSEEWGFGVKRQIYKPNATALDVANQYYHAKKYNLLTKEDDKNFNNRWLQFASGDKTLTGPFDECARYMFRLFQVKQAHIYANWIQDGHNYGRHKDGMTVILVQMWGQTAYCVESENQHNSFTLSPGDALYIRHGVYHTPIILEQRATMSFSWFK